MGYSIPLAVYSAAFDQDRIYIHMFEEKNKEEIKPIPPALNEPVAASRLPEDLVDEVMKSGPAKAKIIIFVIIGLIVLGGISLGGYLIYQRFFGQKETAPETVNLNQNTNYSAVMSENDQVICFLKNNPAALSFFAQGAVRNAYTEISARADFCPVEGKDLPAELYSLISRDIDGDGLNAFVEGRIGTDDAKSDTDGDSHSDLTEINNGYNPFGAGKLEALTW